jgi:hypothetical protein
MNMVKMLISIILNVGSHYGRVLGRRSRGGQEVISFNDVDFFVYVVEGVIALYYTGKAGTVLVLSVREDHEDQAYNVAMAATDGVCKALAY